MGFSLELADTEEIKKQVEVELAPQPETQQAIVSTVEKNGNEIMAVDLDNLESRKEITTVINDFGKDLVEKSQSRNNILQKRLQQSLKK